MQIEELLKNYNTGIQTYAFNPFTTVLTSFTTSCQKISSLLRRFFVIIYASFYFNFTTIDTKLLFSVASVFINFSASAKYIHDVFKKRTEPHSYTWLIWAITEATATAAAFYGGGGWGTAYLIFATLVNVFIFLLSLKYGTKNINIKDKIALAAALLAIVIWRFTHNPLLAVIMVTIIDVIGYFPSFRKTFQEPWSETLISWAGFTFANACAIFALAEYNPLTVSYLAALVTANLCMVLICIFRRHLVPKHK